MAGSRLLPGIFRETLHAPFIMFMGTLVVNSDLKLEEINASRSLIRCPARNSTKVDELGIMFIVLPGGGDRFPTECLDRLSAKELAR